jgi:hypothetical protein
MSDQNVGEFPEVAFQNNQTVAPFDVVADRCYFEFEGRMYSFLKATADSWFELDIREWTRLLVRRSDDSGAIVVVGGIDKYCVPDGYDFLESGVVARVTNGGAA